MLPGFTGFLPRYFQLFWVFFSVNRFVELTQHLTRPPSTSSDWCVGGGVKKWNENWRQMKSSRPRPPTGAGTSSFFFSSYSFPFWRPPPQNLARTTKKKTSQGGGVGGGAWPHRGPLFSPYLLVPIKKKKKIKKQPLTHRHKQNGDFFPNFRFPRFSLLFFLFFFWWGAFPTFPTFPATMAGQWDRERERERESLHSRKVTFFFRHEEAKDEKFWWKRKMATPPPLAAEWRFFLCVCVCVCLLWRLGIWSLPSFTEFSLVSLDGTEFYWVLPSFSRSRLFLWLLIGRLSAPIQFDDGNTSVIGQSLAWLGFTEFYRVLPSFPWFFWVVPSFTGFYQVLPGFTEFFAFSSLSPCFYWMVLGFYQVLLGFDPILPCFIMAGGCYEVLPSFTSFFGNFTGFLMGYTGLYLV